MTTPANIRAVLFDVDGVLVDVRFPKVLREALGISPADANMFFQGPFLRCLLGNARLQDALPPFLAKWGWSRSFDDFLDFWFEVESHVHLPTLELADRLRASGYRCFLASTQERLRAQFLERKLGVGERFELAFFSYRLRCQKPDARFYRAVASNLRLPPHQLLLLDDQTENVEGAVASGWNAAVFRIGDNADAIIRAYHLAQEA